MMALTRIGVLTGGGDAPGLNAVIRAATKTAAGIYGSEVLGIKNGFDGLLESGGIVPLTAETVRGILPRGGTILGTANRGNPFARKVVLEGEEQIVDVSDRVVQRIAELGLDCLIVIGGDGTLRITQELYEKGCPVVGVPKTIDNDVGGTDVTFGFDTAVSTATEAIDRLHTTAESHHRVMVLELMGRDAGFIALHAGLAGGADVILIPEIQFRFEAIREKIDERARSGRHFSIVAVAEGAHPVGGEQVFSQAGDELYVPRLGGIGQQVCDFVQQVCQVEARVTVLGHLQRGGTPTAFDRDLATRFGGAAVRLAEGGGLGQMVSLQGSAVADVSLAQALAVPKRVDLRGDAVATASGLGISLGS
jgi:ATP-dependent phosphofructokinase / diphosphate-dependent phosphofructokinase